jgi:hypothetical protein
MATAVTSTVWQRIMSDAVGTQSLRGLGGAPTLGLAARVVRASGVRACCRTLVWGGVPPPGGTPPGGGPSCGSLFLAFGLGVPLPQRLRGEAGRCGRRSGR